MEVDGAGPGPSSEAQQRSDGRTRTQLRTLVCERGVLHRADGSARWAQGGTSVLASIFGPQSTLARKEDPERAVVEVSFYPRAGSVGTVQERLLEHLIRRTVEGVLQAALHPRTCVALTLQVQSDEGGLLACALNAACTALVDAAVPLTSTFVAASVALDASGALLIDPDAKEEKTARATGCFVFTAHVEEPGGRTPIVSKGVLTSSCTGVMSMEVYLSLLDMGHRACQRVAAFSRASLEKAFQRPD